MVGDGNLCRLPQFLPNIDGVVVVGGPLIAVLSVIIDRIRAFRV